MTRGGISERGAVVLLGVLMLQDGVLNFVWYHHYRKKSHSDAVRQALQRRYNPRGWTACALIGAVLIVAAGVSAL